VATHSNFVKHEYGELTAPRLSANDPAVSDMNHKDANAQRLSVCPGLPDPSVEQNRQDDRDYHIGSPMNQNVAGLYQPSRQRRHSGAFMVFFPF
jgi:hypothetical protein